MAEDWRSRANALFGAPLLNAGLGLLAAGRDNRINPYMAAMQGFQTGLVQNERAEDRAMRRDAAARQAEQDELWASYFGGTDQPSMENIAQTPGIAPPIPGDSTSSPAVGARLASAGPPGTVMPMPAAGAPGAMPQAPMTADPNFARGLIASLPEGAAPIVQAMGPQAGGQFLLDYAMRPPPKRNFERDVNGFLRDTATGERVFPGVEAEEQYDAFTGKLITMGFEPGTPEFQQAARDLAMRPGSQVTIQNPGENEYDKERGRQNAKTFDSIQEAARAARRSNRNLNALSVAFEGVDTGPGGELRQTLKRGALALGMDLEALGITDDTSAAELGQALSREMALQLRSPQGGAGMPGAMSDRDREFLESMVPGLSTTPEGRRLIVTMRSRMNDRAIEVAQMAREYEDRNGRWDAGFYDELEAAFADDDMFADLVMPTQSAGEVSSEVTAGDFSGMGAAELQNVDVRSLTEDQLNAYIAATKAAQDQGL